MTKRRSKKYFPNRWQQFKNIKAEDYIEVDFDEFMDYRMNDWELKRQYVCIIRVRNKATGRIKEYAYQKTHAAQKRFRELLKDANIEITIVNSDELHFLSPNHIITNE